MNEWEQTTTERPPDVRFGPGPTDYMPLPWAESLITWLKTHRPGVWMDGMQHVWGIEQTKRRSNGTRP